MLKRVQKHDKPGISPIMTQFPCEGIRGEYKQKRPF